MKYMVPSSLCIVKYKMYVQVVVDDLQRVTRDKKTQKRWSLLLARGLAVDIEPLEGLFRWLS